MKKAFFTFVLMSIASVIFLGQQQTMADTTHVGFGNSIPNGAKAPSGVSFLSQSTGFLAANNGIYRTTNGGKTWSQVFRSSGPVLGVEAKYQAVGKEEYVTAYTKSHIFQSTNGRTFSSETFGGAGTQVQGISLIDDGVTWVLTHGVVYGSDPMGGGFLRRTPPRPVSSIVFTADEIGYAATSNSVYKTVDGGQHWSKVLSAPLRQASWQTMLDAKGNHVAVMFYGGEAGMSQVAYILYESNDGGRTWKPMVSEGYFNRDYNGVTPISNTDIGEQPGPFTMLPSGDIFIIGYDEKHGGVTALTGLSPQGKTFVHGEVGTSGNSTRRVNSFDFPTAPIALSATDRQHIWVVGSKGGQKSVVMVSNDGGHTWG